MSLTRNASYNLIGSVLPLALSLVTVPIYLHLVGVERYGVLQISWLLLGYFGLFDLGLGRATAFRVAAQRDSAPVDRAETFWSALVINLVMGLIGALILWLAGGYYLVDHAKVAPVMRPEMAAAIPLLALSVPVATLTGVLTGALQGQEKFFETNIISIISTSLFQILPLLVAAFSHPYLPALLMAALAARGLALIVLGARCWAALLAHQPVSIRLAPMLDLLRYGGWVTLTAIFGPMLVIADRFAMGALVGMAAVAVYSIPYNLSSRIAVLPAALTNALFPRMSSAAPEEAREMGGAATRWLLCLVTPPVLVAILSAEPFMRLWVGVRIGTEAAPIAHILILAFWFNALTLIAFTRLQAKGRPDLVTKILLVQIPPYWLALYFGMTRLGLLGCALAFLGRMVLDFVLQSWVNDRAFTHARIITRYLALLVGAMFWAERFTPRAPVWWLGAMAIALLSGIMSWRDLPEQVRRSFIHIRIRRAPA